MGRLTINANPIVGGVRTASADLFISALYVEVDNFDIANPQDELPRFLPGAHVDGRSVLPGAMPQQIRLHVLTGSSSRGSVTFELADVSSYPGVAMNFPVNSPASDPDMYFLGGSPATNIRFTGADDTVAVLYVNDYAARGTLKVTVTSGRNSYALPTVMLPVDRNDNKIADRGWVAGTAPIPDPGLDPGADEDDHPAMTVSLPDSSSGIGDTLTNFEEYRGFVIFNEHRRTNPFYKDYFIEAAVFGDDVGYAYPALNPVTVHRTSILNYSGNRADLSRFQVINPNFSGLPGASSHLGTTVVHVEDGVYDPGGNGGITRCGSTTILGAPRFPGLCSLIFIYTQNVANAYPSDPVSQLTLRRAVLAHQAGHSVNFFHHFTAGYLMYIGQLQSTGTIPTSFLVVPSTMVDCDVCNPPQRISVTNWDETSTLRIRP